MGEHDFERVEQHGERYVLVCRCGWRSQHDASAATIGEEWDEHRMAVGAAR